MNIKVKINKILEGDKPTKAYATVTIDDSIAIHGVGVVIKEKGRYVSMPFTRFTNSDGEEIRRDVCHPISSSVRNEVEEAVFKAYEEKINEINN